MADLRCDVSYPGSDGITRSVYGRLTTDHPQSSYGLPVLVIDEPGNPGPLAESLPAGVYGTADLPAGTTIRVHERLSGDADTWDQFKARLDAVERAGYPIGQTRGGKRRP